MEPDEGDGMTEITAEQRQQWREEARIIALDDPKCGGALLRAALDGSES